MPRQRKEGAPVRRLTIALPESLEAAVLAVNQATAVPVSRMLDLIREDLEVRMCGADDPEGRPRLLGASEFDQRAAIANLIAMIEADDIARREEAKQKLGLGPRRVETRRQSDEVAMPVGNHFGGLVLEDEVEGWSNGGEGFRKLPGADDELVERSTAADAGTGSKVVDLMEALKSSLAAPERAARGVGDLASVPDLRRTEEVSPRLAHMFEDDVEPATVEDAEGHQGVVVEPTEEELAPVVQLERREAER